MTGVINSVIYKAGVLVLDIETDIFRDKFIANIKDGTD